MKLGLVIGRFQPLHNGHLSLIEKSRAENEHTLVILGTPNRLPDFAHPFPAEERINLIHAVLPEGDDYSVVTLKDVDTDDEWIQNLIATVLQKEEDPTQVTLYTAKKDEKWYRKNLLFPVETVDTVDISGTLVRHAWYTNSLWTVERFLPQLTIEFLKKHKDFSRLSMEYDDTQRSLVLKMDGHPFNNPIEPVSFAVIVQDNKILVGKRGGLRGNGQYGLPGGYIEKDESTLDASIRETKEELGIDLETLITEGNAKCMCQVVEENLNDIGTRTLGVNYLFVVNPEITLDIQVDGKETTDFKWLPLRDVLEEKELLFFNHNLVVQRLLSSIGKQ